MPVRGTTDQMPGSGERPDRAPRVPVRRVTYGDSRSVTDQPAVLLTCAAAGPPVTAASFASRGSATPWSHPSSSWTMSAAPSQGNRGEPEKGANVFGLTSTQRDLIRAFAQV